MKWMSLCGALLAFNVANAMADSCWIVTGLAGKTAFPSDGYAFTDDGFRDSVFIVRISESPSISVAGGVSSYGPGQVMKVSDSMVIYVDPNTSATAEVWSFDQEQEKALVTQSRAGFGPLNKAAAFIGRARSGC